MRHPVVLVSFLGRVALGPLLLAAALGTGCVTSRPEQVTVAPSQRAEVAAFARELTTQADSDREKALRIFAFVRDEIEYGFTRRFDEATPDFTLHERRGHCNPQTELLVEMMRSVGIDARQRFVTIDPEILDGLLPPFAKPLEELNHSYAEVRLDGRWIRIDGFAVDPPLWLGARQRLARIEEEAGLGVHVDSCQSWDGRSDCMGQLVDPRWVRELHDPVEPARDFYAGPSYTQRMRGLVGFFYRNFGVPWMNRKLEAIRREGSAGTPPMQNGQESAAREGGFEETATVETGGS